MTEKQLENKKKVKMIDTIGGILIGIIIILTIFPPLVGVWDRNDIWIGFMPLSQVMIILLPLLAGIILWIVYALEGKYVDEDVSELQEGGE